MGGSLQGTEAGLGGPATEFGVPAARAGQYGTILMTPTGARREPTPEAMRRAIIAFERTGELRASDRTPEQ